MSSNGTNQMKDGIIGFRMLILCGVNDGVQTPSFLLVEKNPPHQVRSHALPERVQLRREAFNDFVEKQLETLQLGLYGFVLF